MDAKRASVLDRRTPSPRNNQRLAFTVLELIAVVFIIGLLVGLLLPAVLASREASRRTECVSHLRQFGLALSQHLGSTGYYPAGIRPDGYTNRGQLFGAPSAFSVHAQLLPYLEQSTLFNALNIPSHVTFGTTVPPDAENITNITATANVVSVFLCPSDRRPFSPGSGYRASVGPNPYTHDGGLLVGGGGVFPGLNAIRDRDITDGLSQTVGMSERLLGSGTNAGFSPQRDIWFSSVSSIYFPDSDQMAEVCTALSSGSPSYWPTSGQRWANSGLQDTLYNHVTTPNWHGADCSATGPFSTDYILGDGSIAARSAHSGGVEVLMMDGAVQFVKQGVHVSVWRALGSRSGAEVVSGAAY
jgi:type II secretory pathway pseudopilin PulG